MVEKWGACLGSNEYGEQDEQPGLNTELFKFSLIELSTLSCENTVCICRMQRSYRMQRSIHIESQQCRI
jgi:hypothetical protein